MASNQSTSTALLLVSNSTDLDHSLGSDIDDHRYVIERFRLAFVVLGIALGVIAIGFNAAIVISSLAVKTSSQRFSSQTIHLMASLAVADLFLLVFGLPYDLVAANDNPWPHWLEGRIGCPMSAYLPEASRFAWVGTVALLAMPFRWPSVMRKWGPAWTLLVWAVSLVVVIPFALHVDCLGQSHTTAVDYAMIPETAHGSLLDDDNDGACSCVFTVSQSEVVQMFGSSLVAYSLISAMAIGTIGLKSRPFSDEAPHIKVNTSSRRLVTMLLAFMACTLPRYVYNVVNYSEQNRTADGLYGLTMSILEILCCSLFYGSTLIHLMLSPHPRSLLRHLCRQQPDYAIEAEVA